MTQTSRNMVPAKRLLLSVLLAMLLCFFAPRSSSAFPVPSQEEITRACGGLPARVPALADRMPIIPANKLTEAQKKAVVKFRKIWEERTGRKDEFPGGVVGPYVDLLRSPQVLMDTLRLGTQLQFHSVLPPVLRQFIMTITARQWSQEYMWSVHCPEALGAGLDPSVVGALKEGRRPEKMTPDEAIVYDFLDELRRNQSVSDVTYDKAVGRFGEQGVIEMIGLHGYYTYLSMVLNATRHPVREGRTRGLPLFPH